MKDPIKRDKYFKCINEFLTNEKFLKYISEKNINVKVVLHSFIHDFYEDIKNLESTNVKVLPKDTNVQNELIENSLLITDYSSVCWDFAYMNKPVIFYQFDLDYYNEERGSYLDLKKDLFGERTEDSNELIDLIISAIENDYNVEDEYLDKINEYFKYNDNKNCERIFKIANELILNN